MLKVHVLKALYPDIARQSCLPRASKLLNTSVQASDNGETGSSTRYGASSNAAGEATPQSKLQSSSTR